MILKKGGFDVQEKIIDVSGLKKSYGKVQAVKGISFYVEKGKLFAFLGPNGAGKSTTIDIITTFLKKDSGDVRIGDLMVGKDDVKIRNMIGAVFQDNMLDKNLTVRENIIMRGSLYGLRGKKLRYVAEKAIQAAEVEEFAGRYYGKLSGGQRRRADIARALVNTPQVLFLDEPTTGLDPQTRKSVWDTIRKLQLETGMTVFLTTHYMEEAAEADYVVVINDGMVTARGTPQQLKEKFAGDFIKLIPKKDKYDAIKSSLEKDGVRISENAGTIRISLPDTMHSLPYIDRFREDIEGFEVISGTMDDAFIEITRQGGTDK